MYVPNVVYTEYKGEYSLDKAIGQEYITMQSFRDENWCNSVSTGTRRSLAI